MSPPAASWGTAVAGLALAFLSVAAPADAQEAPEPELPRVTVLSTGGTIASRAGRESLTGEGLVAAVPELARVARLEVEEFSRIGSSAMTPDHWLGLARRVNEIFTADPGLAGIVVTHGTDSMEETAYFLHLTVKDPRPVVVTGAMRSADAVGPDGPANLLDAVRVAAHPDAGGRGALVLMNDEIHSARDVRKLDNVRVDAFRSGEWGALGVADDDAVVFRRGLPGGHTVDTPFDVSGRESLPVVPMVADYAGSGAEEVGAWVRRGADGLVVQAFGGGRTSPAMTDAVRAAAEAGLPVVLASRVPEGRVMPRAVGGRPMAERGLVVAGDLPPHKARVLLMLALTRTHEAREIQAFFDRYYAPGNAVLTVAGVAGATLLARSD
ncbi:MAG: asparaginase [Gemmatimonadetes bacterium]|nr:asparaginase [Gemmatimonadota bacterium]